MLLKYCASYKYSKCIHLYSILHYTTYYTAVYTIVP